MASDPTEAQRVIRDGGQVINNRVGGSLAVTRALGDHCLKNDGVSAEPHYVQHEVKAQDRYLLLASDGVWDVMTDADAQQITLENQHQSCQAIAQLVLSTALSRGTRDNLSCLVVKIR